MLVDRAIDRLKGELRDKEKEQLQPLLYRQKTLQEEQQRVKDKMETRLAELENLVMQ